MDKPAAKFGKCWAVLSRALCLFQRFDFRDIPANERHRVANIRVNQWSPYEQTGKWLHWEEGFLHAWIWDQAALDSGIKTTDVVPETLLYKFNKEHKVRIVRCLEGFEGQAWTDEGTFLTGQWWSHVPEPVDWQRFCCKAGTGLLLQPEPADFDLLPNPWSINAAMRDTIRQRRRTQAIWGVILVAGLLLGSVAGENLRLHRYYGQFQQENDKLIAQVESVFASREQAISDSRASQSLLALWPQVRQLEMMAEVADKLPRDPVAQLRGWHYSDGTLRVVFSAEELDAGVFVRAFQHTELFAEISVEPDNKEETLTLRMNIAELDGTRQ